MFTVNDYFLFKIHGGAGAHSGDFASRLGHFLKNLENLLSKNPGEIMDAVLPGLSNLANIHPLFVHFPIAFLFTFFIIDLFGSLFGNNDWRRFAGWLLYLGTVSALLTVAAGFQAAATVAHSDTVHDVMMQHKNYGITVASLAVFLSIWRILANGYFGIIANTLHLGLSALTCIVMILGTDLGGLMVYKHGVGVAAIKQPIHPHEHNHEHNFFHSH